MTNVPVIDNGRYFGSMPLSDGFFDDILSNLQNKGKQVVEGLVNQGSKAAVDAVGGIIGGNAGGSAGGNSTVPLIKPVTSTAYENVPLPYTPLPTMPDPSGWIPAKLPEPEGENIFEKGFTVVKKNPVIAGAVVGLLGYFMTKSPIGAAALGAGTWLLTDRMSKTPTVEATNYTTR